MTVTVMPECKDCHQPWQLTETEKKWWDEKIKNEGYTMPKRCPKCRATKRQGRALVGLTEIYDELKRMAESAINEEYAENSHQLSQELTDLANKINQYRVTSEHGTGA